MMVVMLNNFFISNILIIYFVILFLGGAGAAEQCSAPYEMITKLHHPDPGSYSVWENIYGDEQKQEEFISVVNKGQGVLLAGHVRSFKDAAPSIMLVELDKRGRKVWERRYFVDGLKNIVKMLEHGAGVVILANLGKSHNREREALWLGFFDGKGLLTAQKIISDKKSDLSANDIVENVNANGWALAVSVKRKIGGKKNRIIRKNAALYLLDKKGNELSRKSYILGTNNEILGLTVSNFGGGVAGYIATGYFENHRGKKIAWVLRLNDAGSYIWQKEYSRGESAKLKLASIYNNANILVFGDVRPVGLGVIGSWLMMLDVNSGEILWQRYYYGESGYHDYLAKGIYANGDGLITIMMMAAFTGKSLVPAVADDNEKKNVFEKNIPEKMDYVHLLTLSPRGITLDGDAYYSGQGVAISQLIEGQGGRRVMAGSAIIPIEERSKDKLSSKEDLPPPLKEEGDIYLPDVKLSDKANRGLALLRNKIKAQDIVKDVEGDKDSSESAKLTKNGWVLVGDMPEEYKDPCIRTPKWPK